jgi:uncharacterized membrane protein YeiH
MLYYLEHAAVTVSAISGVLAAGGKKVDLFGVIVLAMVTALGGGTLRDVLLDAAPVFWIQDPSLGLNAAATALVVFFIARWWMVPQQILLTADAFGLALFTIVGAAKALNLHVGPANAVLFGVVTGVAGGILRDVLLGEIPLVFRKHIYLYATASFCGALLFVALEHWSPLTNPLNRLLGTLLVLGLRLAGLQWKLALPVYGEHESPRRSPDTLGEKSEPGDPPRSR